MPAKTKIQQRREELELSPTDVHYRTGLNQRTLKRYEQRTSEPTLRSLVLLAYALECGSLAELIEDEWLEYRPKDDPLFPPPGIDERPRLRIC